MNSKIRFLLNVVLVWPLTNLDSRRTLNRFLKHFFWSTKSGFNLLSLPPLPQTEMPYERWELTRALYTLFRRLLLITFLMSQSEPTVDATFLPRYFTLPFQRNLSSIITPKNFVSLTRLSWYEPNRIAESPNKTFDSERE